MHWPQAFAHPVYLAIWLTTYAIYMVPEIVLSRRLRSSSEAHKADRGSMPIVIAAANLAVLVGFLSAGAFPRFALPDWRAAFSWGIAIWFAGMLLRWYSIYTLGRFFTFDVAISSGQQVVQRGPYRWIRHPSYSGSLIAEVGFGLTLANSLALILPALCLGAAYVYRIRIEEQALQQGLGAPYREYMQRTWRLVPFVF